MAMSFDIGKKNSRYVAVSNVTMRFDISEKMLFADLRTSRKTGRPKTDANGEVVADEKGKPIPERVYAFWDGRFVGNAFEPAKGLKKGQAIDIINGWIDKENWTGEDGKRHEKVVVVITDFVLSDYDDGGDDAEGEADPERDREMYRALNGDDRSFAGSSHV